MGAAAVKGNFGGRRSAARARLRLSTVTLAWTLGLLAVALLAQNLAYLFWNGLINVNDLIFVSQIVCAFVGALIASHHARNAVGWLLIVFALAVGITVLPFEYAYSIAISHSSLPYVPAALWFANWAQLLPFGLAFAMIALRFPDGRVPVRWRFVDWLAVAGTVVLTGAIAFFPGPLLKLDGVEIDNPFGLASVRTQLTVMYSAGLGLIGAAVVAAVVSLLARYRRADHEQRLQLKWIVLACAVVMITLVVAVVPAIAFHANLNATLTPFAVALNLVPLTIGVAILRHRLFDIDLIISRTLVYAILTAILGGLYVGLIELTQRVFIVYTGQKSDSAIVITAFVVATAFTPVQKWAEKVVERRLGGRDPADKLEAFAASIEGVVRVMDPHVAARRLVEECVGVFGAVGGALYLDSYGQDHPFHAHGELHGPCAIEVAVRHAERSVGRLMLGHRRGGAAYSERDRKALQRSADAVGQALGVGTELGFVPRSAKRGTSIQVQDLGLHGPASEGLSTLCLPASVLEGGSRSRRSSMGQPFVVNITKAAKDNDFFRQVVVTGAKSQLVLMSLQPGEEIGTEVHEVDQILYAVEGEAKVVIEGVESEFTKGVIAFVPAGAQHDVINTGHEPLKLFTIYAPPEHAAGTVHRTKADAELAEGRVVETAKP